MYHNVDLISEAYEDVATGKLQIRQFQPPVTITLQYDDRSQRKRLNGWKLQIFLPLSYWSPALPSFLWTFVMPLSTKKTE